IVKIIPTQWPKQQDTAQSVLRQEIVLAELLPLPKHGNAFRAQQSDQIRLESIPVCPVAFGKERVPITLAEAEFAQKAAVVVVFDILQRGFGQHLAILGSLFDISQCAKSQAEILYCPGRAARAGSSRSEAGVLPGGVTVALLQNLF